MVLNFLKGINTGEILDKFPDAVIIIDFNKKVIFWNKTSEKLFGYKKSEIVEKNINVILNDDIEKIYKTLNSNNSIVLKAKNNLGIELFIEVTSCDYTGKGQVLLSIRDVSEKQKTLANFMHEFEEAKTTSIIKSEFIANLSSTIKSPLHSIIGFAQALLDGLGGSMSEKQEKYISIISKNSSTLLSLLSNVIDLAKIDSNNMEINPRSFDINQTINVLAETVQPFAENKKISFTTDLSDVAKRSCYSDENILRQILTIILNNAVKFTDKGSILFKVVHPDLEFVSMQGIYPYPAFNDKSYLMFSVTDTGIGIAESELNNIFNEYRKMDEAITKKYGGSGLSLALAFKLVKQLGGVMWVESEIKQGSTFNFIIPIEPTPRS